MLFFNGKTKEGMINGKRSKKHEISKKGRTAKPFYVGAKREEGKRRGGARYKYPNK